MKNLIVKDINKNKYEVILKKIFPEEGFGELKLIPKEINNNIEEELIVWYFYEEGIKQCLTENGFTIL